MDMFPSSTWNIGNDPISFSHDQSLISYNKPYFLNETHNNIVINTTPNSKQQFCYFPSSPLFEDENLFPHQQNNHDLHYDSSQPLFTRENNNTITTTTDKAAHVVVAAEPNINTNINNNSNTNKDPINPINLQQQQKTDDPSDLRKNHIRYDDDDQPQQQIPRKKMMVKKDRHSKIVMTTGKRPRHRRMRLSLEVARQFFDLQDMLGFERASKTVEWLLIQARSEIKKLAMESSSTTPTLATGIEKTANSNSNSDCEVVSGLDEVVVNRDLSKPLAKEMKKRQAVSRPRGGFKRPRESRDKARERARERTKLMKSKRAVLAVVHDHDHDDHHLHHDNHDLTSRGFSSWSMETGEEESGTQSGQKNNCNNSLEAVVLQAASTHNHREFEEPLITSWNNGQEPYCTCTAAAANLVEECSLLKYYWSPSTSIFNATTSGSGGSISQEHQLIFGKAWDCNNHNLC